MIWTRARDLARRVDVDPKYPPVRWALRVPWGIGVFTASREGVDVFPFSGPPRVIWLGMRDGRDPLHALRGELAGRLNRYGLETPSRPFRPHLTLGRVNRTVTDLGTALRSLACPGRTEHTVARGSGEPLREPTVAGWIRVPRGRV